MPSKLGQNFLTNKEIVKKIIKSSSLAVDDVVLEIGPGKGILTEELAKKCKKIIAVEIDKSLAGCLADKFGKNNKVEIITGDILKSDILKIIPHSLLQIPGYKVIANLPYYITSSIIRMFLEIEFYPKEMILMVQKEVAERIVAKPGKMSILANSVQYYARPELLFCVDKNNFDPVPEVDSAVIRITHKTEHTAKEEANNFFRVVRAGFCAKRKTLANNLANSFHLDKKEVEDKLKTLGVHSGARAQELDVDKWKEISHLFLQKN